MNEAGRNVIVFMFMYRGSVGAASHCYTTVSAAGFKEKFSNPTTDTNALSWRVGGFEALRLSPLT
jgi:hypothetical protein